MRLLGNILWFIFGGFFSGLSWCISGTLWCITIVGIPYGKQCFKFASLAFWPFGKEVEYGTVTDEDLEKPNEEGYTVEEY